MGAPITATVGPVTAVDNLNFAEPTTEASLNKLALSPASIANASSVVARNIEPATGGGPDLTSLFSAPDDYMNQALQLLEPGPNGEPPSQQSIIQAQQMMEAGQLIFQIISEQMKEQFDNAKTAVKAAVE